MSGGDGNLVALRHAEVDLGGLLELVGSHLYQTPLAAFRELVQNASDSIVRRRLEDVDPPPGKITVTVDAHAGTIAFVDNGAGLTADEVQRFLATIGAGYTRLLRNERPGDELIGLFGVGFLSAFAISDEVVLRTTSYRQPGTGTEYRSRDAQRYTLAETAAGQVGTAVTIHLDAAHRALADRDGVRRALARYCALLAVPVAVEPEPEPVNATPPPWRDELIGEHPVAYRRRRLEFASRFEPRFEPLCTLDVEPGDGSDARGLLWIHSANTYGTSDNRRLTVYCRGMLVDENARDLLPSWAGFVSGVIESASLSPTVSREDLRRDAAYEATARLIGTRLIEGLGRLAADQPEAWRAVLRRHNEALLGAALCDDRLFALLRSEVTVPTSRGDMTVPALVRAGGRRAYVSMAEEPGFVEMLYHALQVPIARGHRYGVAPVVQRYCREAQVELVELGTDRGDAALFEPATWDEETLTWFRSQLCDEDEELVPARFRPPELPLVTVRNRQAELKRRLESDEADRRIATMALRLARIYTEALDDERLVRVYVNVDCPLVAALVDAHARGHRRADAAARALRALKLVMTPGLGDGAHLAGALRGFTEFVEDALT